MPTIATLHPYLEAGDTVASNPLTVVSHIGGYDLHLMTSTTWDGFALESTYLASPQAGGRGTHLVLARAGHHYAPATQLTGTHTPAWWQSALLDHYAVLQDELAQLTAEVVRLVIDDQNLLELGSRPRR